jgi:predicted phage-related endonuclease
MPLPEHGPSIELSTELAGWLAARERARAKAREWQAAADTAQQHITDALESAGVEVGTVNGQLAVRWTTVTSRRVDGARLRADHPHLAELYSTAVVSRRFHVPKPESAVVTGQPS